MMKTTLCAMLVSAGVVLGGAAQASSCSIVLQVTGTVLGGATGLLLDIFTFGASGGTGLAAGSLSGGSAGAVTADAVCPSDPANMIEETSLVGALGTCLETSYMPKNPFWNKRDFCRVPGSPFFAPGGDISIMKGRQLDHDRIIGRLSSLIATAGKDAHRLGRISKSQNRTLRRLSRNLIQCRNSYDSNFGSDRCRIDATARTAKFFSVRAGKNRSVKTIEAIAAARRAVRNILTDVEVTS